MQSILLLDGERLIGNSKFEVGNWRFGRSVALGSAVSANAAKAMGLERRLICFAGQVIKICPKLRRTVEGRHISSQILRSSTATAANYAEARGAESRSDFVHKLRVVLKELNETAVWLHLINEVSLLPPEITSEIVAENHELCRIIAASIKTARSNGD
jgi:four helix bundle protein